MEEPTVDTNNTDDSGFDVQKKPGRRTDAEIKAEGNEELLAMMKQMKEELDSVKEQRQQDRTDVIIQSPGVPKLQRKRIKMTNDTVRGVAHATGGASHNDVIDPETGEKIPWTPACPDWVTETYLVSGQPTEKSRLAEYLYKQAYLNDNKISNFDMLEEAMLEYESRGTLEPKADTGDDPKALASMAVV